MVFGYIQRGGWGSKPGVMHVVHFASDGFDFDESFDSGSSSHAGDDVGSPLVLGDLLGGGYPTAVSHPGPGALGVTWVATRWG